MSDDIYFKNERLTKDFLLIEFCRNDKLIFASKRLGQNVWQFRNSLYLVCRNILQPTRDHINAPIYVTSGYRDQVINLAVGGTVHSAHLRGLAADFVPTHDDNREGVLKKMYAYIRDHLKKEYGELILYREENEKGEYKYTHIHASLPLWNEKQFNKVHTTFKPSQLEEGGRSCVNLL